MARYEELTDEQWAEVEPHIPRLQRRADRRGRPWRGDREIFNGVLWILRTGARWFDLPERYPPYQTCHRRYQTWVRSGALRKILEALAQDLHRRGKIDLSECFIDATFIGAKKGVPESVKHAVARGPRSWQWQTLMVFQSPSTLQVLRRMKSPLCTILSREIFLPSLQNGSLVTALMTAMDSIESLPRKRSR